MKKTVLLIALVALAGCSTPAVVKKKALPDKREFQVWQVARQAWGGNPRFTVEDAWYIYCMNISYIPADRLRQTTGEPMGGQCPVEKAEYMVYDKETKTVVMDTVLSQENCSDCHRL